MSLGRRGVQWPVLSVCDLQVSRRAVSFDELKRAPVTPRLAALAASDVVRYNLSAAAIGDWEAIDLFPDGRS